VQNYVVDETFGFHACEQFPT